MTAPQAAKPTRRRPKAAPKPTKPSVRGNGAPKGSSGNVPYVPTLKERITVEVMVANGFTHQMIAEELGCCYTTIGDHFRTEIEEGNKRVVSRIGKTVAQQALAGCIKSQRLFLDRRGGDDWKPRTALEHSGPDGAPMQTQEIQNMSADELAALAKLFKDRG